MYGCESWTVKKAERRRIDAFELWFWKRLLRVPWTARRSNQSILKAISPGCSLEGIMLKLKLQYFGHHVWRVDSLEKTLMLGAGGEGDDREWDGWMASLTWWTWVWVNSGSWWWTGRPGMLQFMGLQRVGHDWVTELNWSHIWEWLYVIISLCSHRSFHCVHLPYCLYDPNRSSFFTLQWEKPQLLLLAAVISSDYPCGFQSAWHFPDKIVLSTMSICVHLNQQNMRGFL